MKLTAEIHWLTVIIAFMGNLSPGQDRDFTKKKKKANKKKKKNHPIITVAIIIKNKSNIFEAIPRPCFSMNYLATTAGQALIANTKVNFH